MATVFDDTRPLPPAEVANSAPPPPQVSPPPSPEGGGGYVFGTQPVSQQQANSLPQPQAPMAPAPPPDNQQLGTPPPMQPQQQGGQMSPGLGTEVPGQAAQWGKYQSQFGNIQPGQTPYEQAVLSGQYLNLESNPYLQQYTAGVRQELGEEYERSSSQALSPFASAGGTLGFSGISAGTQARMADEYGENVANQISSAYFSLYQGERQLQNQISGNLSQLQAAMYSVAGGAYQAEVGANAQIQSAITAAEATLGSAKMYSEASTYAAELAFKLGNRELWWQIKSQTEQIKQRWMELDETTALARLQITGELSGQQTTTKPPGASYLGGATQGAGFGYGAYRGIFDPYGNGG